MEDHFTRCLLTFGFTRVKYRVALSQGAPKMTPSRGSTRCTAFKGSRRIASGELLEVARRTKEILDRGGVEPVLIFDDVTSEQVELDFRGTPEDVLERLAETRSEGEAASLAALPDRDVPRGPGRPKLGVIAREVTLLPRHWDWLNSQPGGASVALRKLVEEARRVNEGRDRVRRMQEAAYRFMSAMAGNLPDFEEATRALFASNQDRLHELIRTWPEDIQEHLIGLMVEGAGDRAQPGS
jgi:uncharacterized protein